MLQEGYRWKDGRNTRVTTCWVGLPAVATVVVLKEQAVRGTVTRSLNVVCSVGDDAEEEDVIILPARLKAWTDVLLEATSKA